MILSGHYPFAGEAVSASDGVPWHPAAASRAWIVEAHGGAIRAENIGGDDRPKGVRFILRLPV